MKVMLESTTKIITIRDQDGNEMLARIWEGTTESGIQVHAYVTRIAVHKDEDCRQFEAELKECRAPSKQIEAIPLKLII